MPTAVAENYLKQLYYGQQAASGELVRVGDLAAAIGVTPGTATTMVKSLDPFRLGCLRASHWRAPDAPGRALGAVGGAPPSAAGTVFVQGAGAGLVRGACGSRGTGARRVRESC